VRIAIDIDSTLHHHWPLVAAAARRRFGVELPYDEQFPWADRPLSDEQLRACIEDTHSDEAIAGARPYPDAVETVNGWYDQGHEIHVTSHRAERSVAATRRWLGDIGLRHHELWCGDDKVAHCRRTGIGLLIDDSPGNLLRAVDAGILAATLRHPWNEDVRDAASVITAADWRELARLLEPVLDEARPSTPPGALRARSHMRSAGKDSAGGATIDVLIAGGGPFGLMLANELGRRGISVALFDAKPSTAVNPQANATQARTMEHYRRLGFADEVRSLGLPEDFPTDIAYFTRFTTHELARFRLPSAREARERVTTLSGSWSAAELPHRVSQKYVEQVLRRHAEALPGVSIDYGWRLTEFAETAHAVTGTVAPADGGARRRITARYLVGADGARSDIRKRLEIVWTGETGVVRDFFGGRMYAIHLRSPAFYDVVPHPPAWMNVTFNRDRRAFMAAVDGKGEFAFHTQLREGVDREQTSAAGAAGLFHAAVGARIDATVLSCDTWTAGHALVAERFGRGRVLLGGDAAHLFTPAGGLGYNTAVEDAVNLGWKLAAAVRGVAGPRLVESYELERRPAAVRNTGYARAFAESLGRFVAQAGLEDDGPLGERLRREAGHYLEKHGRAEFDIPGITFGTRYAASPVIAYDGSPAAPDSANSYEPSASPGGRAPHLWLDEGLSLFDTFGFEWTLLRLGPAPPHGARLVEAARRLAIQLDVVDVPSKEALDLYEAPLALIRPDQVVAWRGFDDAGADAVARVAVGYGVDHARR